MSQASVRQAEIAIEQKHVDVVYTRLAEMRVEAEQMRDRGDQLAHGARTEAVFEQASMLYERDVMVRYANRTPDKRLRFPRYLRLRDDKTAAECAEEDEDGP